MLAPSALQSILDQTIKIINEDGFDGYLPTLIYDKQVAVLEGVPAIQDTKGHSHQSIVDGWIAEISPSLPYVIIFLDSPTSARMIHVKLDGNDQWAISNVGGCISVNHL